MTKEGIDKLLKRSEGLEIEFKESFFELNKNSFETICAFLNRHGGHLLLGITNNGKVEGVLDDKANDFINAIVTNANNPQKLYPVFYLSPELIEYDDKKIIHVWVPESSQVHQTAGKIFDRNQDGDFEITGQQHLIRLLHLRKQQSYTENKIYPALQLPDFRVDLFQKIRLLARSQRPDHPWLSMDDHTLMRSAGLYQKDYQTGSEGFTLAAALLMGKDEVIQSILPHYKTDAIYRVVNTDRYDDRDDIRTNLLEAYEMLMAFIAKHLPEKFYQENTQRVNLRDRLFREVVANILVHHEYANAFPAKLVIERERVFTENWNKSHINGIIDPSNFTPYPKNPIIAKFFKEIGRVEELGSGVRNMFKYGFIYSNGKVPEFKEGDVFSSIIPIDAVLQELFIDFLDSNQDSNQEGNQDGALPHRFTGNIRQKAGFRKWITMLHELFEPLIQAKYFDLYKDMLEEFPAEWKKVLEFCQQPKTRKEILEEALGVSNQTKNFRTNVSLLLEYGLLTRTEPEKPQSKHQKYITTHNGEKLLDLLNAL